MTSQEEILFRQLIQEIARIKKIVGITDTLEKGTYSNEMAQDAVGTILTDTTTIDFTYTDATPAITAAVIADSIGNTLLANMAADTIKGRANAAGIGDPTDLTATQVRTIINVASGADVTGTAITALAAKVTPVDADAVVITDSAAADAPKRTLWSNVKATLKTYFDTLYLNLTTAQTVAGIKTFTSQLNMGDGTAGAVAALNGAFGFTRDFVWYSASAARWIFRMNSDTESGGNAGSNFTLMARTDAGGINFDALKIIRSSGIATWYAKNAAPIFAASTAAGLRLEDDGGNLGVFIEGGGKVGVGSGGTVPTSALYVREDSTGGQSIRMLNLTAGAAAQAFLHAQSDALSFQAGATSSTWTAGADLGPGEVYFQSNVGSMVLRAIGVNDIRFSTNGVNRVIITGAGLMGIGTTSPAASLDILQPTLGSAVQKLASTATNDDPAEIVYQNRVATTDATVTTLHTFTVPTSTSYMVEVAVIARRTGGVSGAAEDGAAYILRGLYKNTAGTVAIIGAVVQTVVGESQAAWDSTLDTTGATVRVRVTGAASNSIVWHATSRVWMVST